MFPIEEEEGFYGARLELVDYTYIGSGTNSVPSRQAGSEYRKESLNCPLVDLRQRQDACRCLATQYQNGIVYCSVLKADQCSQQFSFDASGKGDNLEFVGTKRSGVYQLYLRPDSNTEGYMQWFRFKITHHKGRRSCILKIRNISKPSSLYGKGLTPYARSIKTDNPTLRQLEAGLNFVKDQSTGYYTLCFQVPFSVSGETLEICCQLPYDLERVKEVSQQLGWRRKILCVSNLKQKVPYFVFPSRTSSEAVGIALARQHPGETMGSWMIEGFMKRIAQGDLFPTMTWIIVPMMNPDGVALGNTRTGLLGHDYNRCWNAEFLGKKDRACQQISAIVQLAKQARKNYDARVKMVLDFHGHSSQPNVFAYGPPHQPCNQFYYQSRVFTEHIASVNPNFDLNLCSFTLHPDKKDCSRSYFFSVGVPFTFTIEASYGVYNRLSRSMERVSQSNSTRAADLIDQINLYSYRQCSQVKMQVFNEAIANQQSVQYDKLLIQMGSDIAVCASQFADNFIVVRKMASLQTLLEDVKIRYNPSLPGFREVVEVDSDTEEDVVKRLNKPRNVAMSEGQQIASQKKCNLSVSDNGSPKKQLLNLNKLAKTQQNTKKPSQVLGKSPQIQSKPSQHTSSTYLMQATNLSQIFPLNESQKRRSEVITSVTDTQQPKKRIWQKEQIRNRYFPPIRALISRYNDLINPHGALQEASRLMESQRKVRNSSQRAKLPSEPTERIRLPSQQTQRARLPSQQTSSSYLKLSTYQKKSRQRILSQKQHRLVSQKQHHQEISRYEQALLLPPLPMRIMTESQKQQYNQGGVGNQSTTNNNGSEKYSSNGTKGRRIIIIDCQNNKIK